MIGCLLAYLQEFLETWFLKRHNDKMHENPANGVSNQFRQNRITTHDDTSGRESDSESRGP